ncbi:MAG TPA: fused MFS/spermidine synthase [Anaerolineae bacterium]|nr:fused MFS/spermidine synthase [Anaerolineae bacterium]
MINKQPPTGAQPPLVSNRQLLITVFFSGLVTLAVELSAFRLFAPVFGASNLISAVVIGLILLYLSAGYVLGGRWADRSPSPTTLYCIIAWGAFLIGLIPFVALPLLRIARDSLQNLGNLNVAIVILAFIITLILFAVPVTLMGCVSPFAVRLAMHDVTQSGRTVGRLYAVSTLGSFLGSFLPELVLLDLFGTRGTFVFLALLLLALALFYLKRTALKLIWMPIALILLTLFVPLSFSNLSGTIYQGESGYNYIQVVERSGTRYLLLNEGQGIHSVYNPQKVTTGGTWDYFTIAPFFNAPPYDPSRLKRIAIVGLAGGSIARLYTELYGPLPIDGIEIDPKIVEVGRDYFGMNQPNLNVIVGDGRAAIANSTHQYDVIALDAFRVPYIPWHLTTREFMQELRDHLTPDGVIAINVGRTRTDYQMVDAMAKTAAEVFPSVYVIDVAGSFNSIVYATNQPTALENLRTNLSAMPTQAVRDIAAKALARVRPLNPEALTFTDDRAPVERLTNEIMLSFLFGVGSGEIKLQ